MVLQVTWTRTELRVSKNMNDAIIAALAPDRSDREIKNFRHGGGNNLATSTGTLPNHPAAIDAYAV
jgi:hypothetical protein